MLDEWEEAHEASALDRLREVSLSLGAKASATAVHHTSVWVYMCTETDNVLVVDVVQRHVFSLCFFHVVELGSDKVSNCILGSFQILKLEMAEMRGAGAPQGHFHFHSRVNSP